MIKYISKILLLLVAVCHITVDAAEVARPMGFVTDEYGNPIFGAVVYDENGKSVGTTNVDGKFEVYGDVVDKPISVAYIGYETVNTTYRDSVVVVLPFDLHRKNQKINLGNREVERQDFGGAADVALGETLDRQPVARFTSAFAGNFPSLSVMEQPGQTELSLEQFNYYIRGLSDPHANAPLIVIDGTICYPGTEAETLAYLTTSEIESVSVLKDVTSQALYGGQGLNGVMVVTTKRGTAGKMRVNAYLDFSMSELSVTPHFMDSYNYALLRNEAAKNDGFGNYYFFSPEQLEGFKEGTNKYDFPNNDWRSMFMRRHVFTQRAAFDLQGGSEWVNYYVNGNILHEGGTFNVEDNSYRFKRGDYNNSYSPNTNYFWANFRSNVEAKICSWLSTRVNLSGNLKKHHTPYAGSLKDIYSHFFYTPPTIYGPVTPVFYDEEGNVDDFYDYPPDQPVVTEHYTDNAFAQINRTGFSDNMETNINASVMLDINLDMLTKGLHVSGVFGYHSFMNKKDSQYTTYRRYLWDHENGAWSFNRYGSSEESNLMSTTSRSSYSNINYRAYVDYNRTFAGVHAVQAQGFAYLEKFDGELTTNALVDNLPYKFINSGFDVSYTFDHRYGIRGVWSRSASDLFARSARWQSLPALSLSWNLSNEPFMRKARKYLSNALFRYSIGKTGSTRVGDTTGRYVFDDQVSFATGGGLIYAKHPLVTEVAIGNPLLHPENMKKWNFGVDLGFMNWVNISFDLFREKMDDWIIRNTLDIPEYQGASLSVYPVTNTGIYENKGWEVTLNIGHNFRNWEFSVGGYVAYNKNKIVYQAEEDRGEGYVYPKRAEGFEAGQTFGYLVDYSNGNGFFNFQEELDNAPVYTFGNPRLGDLKFIDLNEDGQIDEKDMGPIGTGRIPRWNFGFNGYFRYHDFDLSFMFQGVGGYRRLSYGAGFLETGYDGLFSPLHQYAWTAERWANGEEIRYPALSYQAGTNTQSNSFYVLNRSYLRLKQVELGYYLPRSITRKFHCQKFKIFLSGNNLFTWHKLPKGLDGDPEQDFYILPAFRTYNIGIRTTF
ncbi:MAG: SusC/RagA family TonB-linked outer membrane protein [Muribaculaceae bacterium]|nr:SusC/RagA family TonB-linked outer membrane protein [Muribaculaceae bacterium]